jgi:3-oxoacyl-[acyl-carrier-protein] synthase II
MNNRVVITGVGMVTPLGAGKDPFLKRLLAGESGISPITSFDTARFRSRLGGEVRDFSPKEFISLKNMRRMDRLSHLAAASARMALDDAGVAVDPENRDRIGIILGTAFGSTEVAAGFTKTLFEEGPKFASPLLVPNTVMNAPAGHAAIELGIRGVNSTVNHREASAETAIAYGAAEIVRGRADVLLAGGADILSPFFFEVLSRFRSLSPTDGGPEGARPFDVSRNGYVAGEGAGVVCLESFSNAQARGTTPYCEIAGWGMGSGPSSPTDWPSDSKGSVLAVQKALQAADIPPEKVDVVFAGANGGEKPDRLEADALARVFGNGGAKPFVVAMKGALGESFSSGGIRTAALALCMREKSLPPTLGLITPLADLDFARQPVRDVHLQYGLVNCISSGGTFVSLVLRNLW